MSDHKVLREASFERASIKKYYVWQWVLICVCTVVMIPVLPIALLIIFAVMDKYLDRLSCTLTERTLEIKKGMLNRVESTVPLEKVTDLQMYQGPIMRALGLHGFKVETAGQSAGAAGGSLVNMLGITDAPAFRRAVLEQRDKVVGSGGKRSVADTGEEIHEGKVLVEIRDAMLRIERKLSER